MLINKLNVKLFCKSKRKSNPYLRAFRDFTRTRGKKMLGKLRRKLWKETKNKKGQATLEYIIISSLIGIFCLFAMKRIGQVLEKRLNYIKTSITKNLPMDK